MIRLNVGGRYLDLYADTSLQFVRKNILFAFDDIEVSRTAEFSVPATPNNNSIFGLANNPARYGRKARARLSAQLQYSGGVENGYLYISSANKKEYKVIYVYGALLGLQAIKEAGEVAQVLGGSDSVVFGGPYKLANRSVVYNLFDNVAYANGHTTEPDAEQFVGYESHYFPLPSWNVEGVLRAALTNLGVALDTTAVPDLQYMRVTVAQPKAMSSAERATIMVASNVAKMYNSNYMQAVKTTAYYDRGNGMQSWQMQTFKVLHNVQVEIITGLSGVTLIDVKGGDQYEVIETVLTAGATIDLERGMNIAFVRNTMLPTGSYTGIEPVSSYTYSAEMNATGAGDEPARTETIYLADNLPQMTAVELLKIAAAMTGSLLDYEEGTVTLKKPTFNATPIIITDIIEASEVRRTFADYAQINKVLWVDNQTEAEQNATIYEIDNENLAESNILLEPHLSLGLMTDIGNAGQGYEYGVVLVRDLSYEMEIATDDPITTNDVWTYLAKVGTAIYCDSNEYAMPIPYEGNEAIERLCYTSTSIKVDAVMPLCDFQRISTEDTFVVQGQRYVWTEMQWREGVASMQLSKI